MASDHPWQARSDRARELAHIYPSTAEALVFYADLAEFQETLLRSLSGPVLAPAGPRGRDQLIAALDHPRYRALVPKLLSWLQRSAPPPLASSAQRLSDDAPDDRQRMFEAYWAWAVGDGEMGDETRAFVVEAVLQPFAERLAGEPGTGSASARQDSPEQRRDLGVAEGVRPEPSLGDSVSSGAATRCPACGGRPVVGVLREAGQGARRALVCGLCGTEWRVPRISCPGCGETRFDALTTIRADTFANAQVDVCSSCRTCLKTLDLSRNNTMIPIVDDLATLPLDLWAREQGFTRLRPHLLRL